MNALIVYGGWSGHEPDKVAEILRRTLAGEGVAVEMGQDLAVFGDREKLAAQDLIVPCWTMGKLEWAQEQALCDVVAGGVGIAGVHGGMGDAFREATNYQFMVGGQFVAHPGGQYEYRVYITDPADPITEGLTHFNVRSEQYYMHVDPTNHVLAATLFEFNGCLMPVVWKRTWGKGRVFYSSLGHVAAEFEIPQTLELIRRGMLWAARK